MKEEKNHKKKKILYRNISNKIAFKRFIEKLFNII